MAINSQRYFMRKQEYDIPAASPDSSFKHFDVKCIKCQSHQLKLTAYFDQQSGETYLVFFCTRCRQQERMEIRF